MAKLFYFVLRAFACAIIENGKKKFNAFALRVNLKNHQYSFQQLKGKSEIVFPKMTTANQSVNLIQFF